MIGDIVIDAALEPHVVIGGPYDSKYREGEKYWWLFSLTTGRRTSAVTFDVVGGLREFADFDGTLREWLAEHLGPLEEK